MSQNYQAGDRVHGVSEGWAGIDVQPAASDGSQHDVQVGGGSIEQTDEFRSRARDLLAYMPY